jgi:VIT1/CCC1 family predicted Fe2+/Mn2+ transporter
MNDAMAGREELEKGFLRDELLDRETYARLARGERIAELRQLFEKLAEKEEEHVRIWRTLLGDAGDSVGTPWLAGPRVLLLSAMRKLLGIAFVTKLLERDEGRGLQRYKEGLSGRSLGERDRAQLRKIIKDEESHELAFAGKVQKYEGELGYTQSIILGLNDGLVEILAVVAGLATVATTSFIVVIIGLIAGISGTLSMAGGVYLSSKSQGLVEEEDGAARNRKILPSKEGYYTGVYYFLGAILAVLPFIAGLQGYAGILASIVIVSAALVVASTIIAIISGTSIRRRSLEMLAISLGAAFATILFGTFARIYFGVTI